MTENASPQDQSEIAGQAEQAAADLAEATAKAKEAAEKSLEAAESLQAAQGQVDSQLSAMQALTDSSHVNEFIYLGAIFVLAIFVGYYVVWSVTPALHTPLMSVTNAVSSVVIVGALIAVGADVAGSAAGHWSKILGMVGVALASVNIFGGFMVTQRMLAMYKKKES
ncbi:MAG: NAD(P) transhydrogenase subunit alpha [bacterium]